MGSAIGDYVHLMHINYVNYGTSMYGGKFDSRTQSYAAQKRKNLERLTSLEASGIDETVLDELRKRVANENTQKQAMKIAQSKIKIGTANQTVSDIAKEVILDKVQKSYSTNISGGNAISKTVSGGISANDITANAKSKKIDLEKAKTAKNTLYKSISRLNEDMQTKSMSNRVVNQRLKTIKQNFNDFFSCLGLASNVKGKSIASLFNIDANTGSLAALYNFLKEVQYSSVISELNGAYGESLVALANYTSQEVGNKAVQETVDSFIKGKNTAIFTKGETLASQAAVKAMTDTELAMFNSYTTQNKVDVQITLKDSLGIEQDVEASVKAYSVRKGNSYYTPHLQDVDLFSSLATTENNFGNHWLNLHASGRQAYMGSQASDEMDSALKEHIAYEALVSGNMLKDDASLANTFVSIDVTNGEVYVKSTADILSNNFNNFGFYPNIESIVFNNKKEQTWERRIATLIADVHKIKIYTSYKVMVNSNSK